MSRSPSAVPLSPADRLTQRLAVAQAEVMECNLDVGHIGARVEGMQPYEGSYRSISFEEDLWVVDGFHAPEHQLTRGLSLSPLHHRIDREGERNGTWDAELLIGRGLAYNERSRLQKMNLMAARDPRLAVYRESSRTLYARVRTDVVVPLGRFILREGQCDFLDLNGATEMSAANIIATEDPEMADRYKRTVGSLRQLLCNQRVETIHGDGGLHLYNQSDYKRAAGKYADDYRAFYENGVVDEKISAALGDRDERVELVIRFGHTHGRYEHKQRLNGNPIRLDLNATDVLDHPSERAITIVGSYPEARNQPPFYPFGQQLRTDRTSRELPVAVGGELPGEDYLDDLAQLVKSVLPPTQ